MKAPRYIYECQTCKTHLPEATGLNIKSWRGWCSICQIITKWIKIK